jgi:hypothetical protein
MDRETTFCLGLIGKPWVAGGRGPDTFDCWGLLVHVYRELLGIELPAYTCMDVQNKLMVAKTIVCVFSEWGVLPTPKHLCAVGISANRKLHHLGVWLDLDGGGVLHASETSGVVFQSVASLRQSGLQNIVYFNHTKS